MSEDLYDKVMEDIKAARENKYGRYGYDEESQVDFDEMPKDYTTRGVYARKGNMLFVSFDL